MHHRLDRTQRYRMQRELKERLLRYSFTHFVTLASNDETIRFERMRNLLRQWDARVARDLVGPRWVQRPDDRPFWFAFPEKFGVNGHWHLLIELDPQATSPAAKDRAARFPRLAERHWIDLLPRGSFDCQTVESKPVIGYVVKCMQDERHFEQMVICREFWTI